MDRRIHCNEQFFSRGLEYNNYPFGLCKNKSSLPSSGYEMADFNQTKMRRRNTSIIRKNQKKC